MLILFIIYILIADGSTFPRSQHICNCKYTCQRVLCLLTWRHQQRVASHCFGKLWLSGELLCRYRIIVYGPFEEHLGRPKIANEVRRLCWPNLGCERPLVETRSARPAGRTCRGGGVWLGGTDWGDCGRKVSTQRKHACVFAGSDVWGKCKRITLTLSSILTFDVCM